MKNKILITGSSGRFGASLKKIKTKHKLICSTRKQMNITKINSIKSYLKKTKPKILIHLAGLSRPMIQHEKKISESITNLDVDRAPSKRAIPAETRLTVYCWLYIMTRLLGSLQLQHESNTKPG